MAHYVVTEDDWEIQIINKDEIATQEIREADKIIQDNESTIRGFRDSDESIHENERMVGSVKYTIPLEL
jgi:hypothetical protein